MRRRCYREDSRTRARPCLAIAQRSSPAAFAFALRFQGRKRVHNDKIMAEIVAKRLVEHLERAGFVVLKRPTDVGGAALGRRFGSA